MVLCLNRVLYILVKPKLFCPEYYSMLIKLSLQSLRGFQFISSVTKYIQTINIQGKIVVSDV